MSIQNPNHHNFLCSDEDTAYLKKIAKDRNDADFSTTKSETFRLVIQEHKNGKFLTERASALLIQLAQYYHISCEELAEKLFSFMIEKKPDIKILEEY